MTRSFTPSTFLLFCAAGFGALRMLVGATSALFLLSQGLDLTQLAYLKAMQAVIVVVLEVPLGYLADTMGRRWAIVAAVAFGAAWLLMTGLAPSPGWLWAAEVCNALSICLSTGALTAEFLDRRLAEQHSPPTLPPGDAEMSREPGEAAGPGRTEVMSEPEEKARLREALAVLSRWEFAASAVAAGVGGLLYPVFPRGTWVVAGLGCLVLACSYLAFSSRFPSLEAGPGGPAQTDPGIGSHGSATGAAGDEKAAGAEEPPGTENAATGGKPAGDGKVAGTGSWRTVFELRRELLGSIAVAGLLYAAFQVAIQYWQVSVTEVFPESFADHSLGPVLGGLFVAILWVQSRVTRLSRVIADSPVNYLLAAALPAGAWVAAQITGSFSALAFALLLFFWFFRACDVAVSAAISAAAGVGLRATALAARSTLARLLAAGLLPVAGVAVARFDGSAGAVFVVLAVCLTAGVVFALGAARARRAG